MGTLPRDLCKVTLGLVRKSAVSGNSIGDRLVREPGDTGGPWPGEFTGLRLGKTPWKVKREERDK